MEIYIPISALILVSTPFGELRYPLRPVRRVSRELEDFFILDTAQGWVPLLLNSTLIEDIIFIMISLPCFLARIFIFKLIRRKIAWEHRFC